MEDKIKYLFEDLWKDELTKTGKFELEQQVRLLAKFKIAFKELKETLDCDTLYELAFKKVKELEQKYNLGGE